jgi:hypothetical protein
MKNTILATLAALMLAGTFSATVIPDRTIKNGEGSAPIPFCGPGSTKACTDRSGR